MYILSRPREAQQLARGAHLRRDRLVVSGTTLVASRASAVTSGRRVVGSATPARSAAVGGHDNSLVDERRHRGQARPQRAQRRPPPPVAPAPPFTFPLPPAQRLPSPRGRAAAAPATVACGCAIGTAANAVNATSGGTAATTAATLLRWRPRLLLQRPRGSAPWTPRSGPRRHSATAPTTTQGPPQPRDPRPVRAHRISQSLLRRRARKSTASTGSPGIAALWQPLAHTARKCSPHISIGALKRTQPLLSQTLPFHYFLHKQRWLHRPRQQ